MTVASSSIITFEPFKYSIELLRCNVPDLMYVVTVPFNANGKSSLDK